MTACRHVGLVLASLALVACSPDYAPVAASKASHGAPTPDAAPASGPASTGPDAAGATTPAGTATREDPPEEAGQTRNPDAPPTEPTVVAGLAPALEARDLDAEQERVELATPFVEVGAEALSHPQDHDLSSIVTVADGPAEQELLALVEEFEVNGWTQVGAPAVVSSTVTSVEEEADPPSAVLEVCLDHSKVDVVDHDGVSQVDPGAPTRVLNILTMELLHDRWVVVERTFPTETDC